MAERSGVPRLDAAIEDFIERGLWHVTVMDWLEDRYVDQPRPLAELNTPLGARGRCIPVTVEFNDFLALRGLEAQGPVDGRGLPTAVSPDALGYADRAVGGLHGHTLTLVAWQGELYSVDWTAAQYGYAEFPLVQRFSGQAWEREWLLAAEAAA